MYAILISFVLAIYTIVLVDFSFLYKEISANNDLLTSTQALYTAEGAVENAVSLIGDNDLTLNNIVFDREANQEENNHKGEFLDYAGGIDASYLKRDLSLNAEFIKPVSVSQKPNLTSAPGVYLANLVSPDEKAYFGLEAKKAKGFVLREVTPELNFNEIHFDFNQRGEASELVFDIFVFPKEGEEINFQDFEGLKSEMTSNSVKRISINTLDRSANGLAFEGGLPLTVDVRETNSPYQKSLRLSGFQPLENNYILHFQTLDNQPTHFKLSAFYQAKPVVLPSLMQTIDLIGATPTGLYQRIKFQREAEEGISPGLNFVHFSEQSIIK